VLSLVVTLRGDPLGWRGRLWRLEGKDHCAQRHQDTEEEQNGGEDGDATMLSQAQGQNPSQGEGER
jgi:hypothetical protein